MQRELGSFLIGSLSEMKKNGKLSFEYSLQREEGQWKPSQKSLLIHSAIIGMDIPSIYIEKVVDNEMKKEVYVVIDGVQRLSTLISYLDNKFALSKDTEDVTIFDKTYHIACKKFSQLPKEIQEHLLHQKIDTKELINYSRDEIEEQFYRLNNGSEFSKQQIIKVKLGEKLAKEFEPIENLDFWDRTGLSKAQKKHGIKTYLALQTIMLVSGEDYGCKFGGTQTEKYAEKINAIYNDNSQTDEAISARQELMDNISKCKQIIEKAHLCLNDDDYINKFLKTSNIPQILAFVNEFMENYEGTKIKRRNGDYVINTTVDEDFLMNFFNEFVENVTSDDIFEIGSPEEVYLQNTGAGSTGKEKAEGRLNAIRAAYDNYCEKTEIGDYVEEGFCA